VKGSRGRGEMTRVREVVWGPGGRVGVGRVGTLDKGVWVGNQTKNGTITFKNGKENAYGWTSSNIFT